MEFVEKLRVSLNATYIDQNVILRPLQTCVEMLRDRGLNIVDVAESIDDVFNRAHNEEAVVVGSRGPDWTTRVMFQLEERVSVKTIRTLMEDSDYDQTIFVSLEGATSFAKKEAISTWGARHVQFFKYRDLIINITHHFLVPKHEATKDHSEQKAYLPHMLTSDPVCQYYDFQPGEIVKITRTKGSVHPFPYYRLVVSC